MKLTPAEEKLKKIGYVRKIIKGEGGEIICFRYILRKTFFLDFDLLDEDISMWGEFAGHNMTTSMDMEVLELINERAAELGWIKSDVEIKEENKKLRTIIDKVRSTDLYVSEEDYDYDENIFLNYDSFYIGDILDEDEAKLIGAD